MAIHIRSDVVDETIQNAVGTFRFKSRRQMHAEFCKQSLSDDVIFSQRFEQFMFVGVSKAVGCCGS
jgi:hypothetical protein